MLSHPVPRLTTPRIAAAFLATAGCLCAWAASAQTLPIPFTHQLVDAAPPAQTHAKGAGDVDGDGLPDLLIAGARDGDGLYWYAAPDWTRHVIVPPGVAGFTTDMKAGDVDGDGDLDVVIPKGFHIGDSVWWYENPRPAGDPAADTWTEHFIGSGGAHDVEIGDVDGDGSLDVLTRHDGTTLFLQTGPDAWATTVLSTRTEEGAGFGDLDGDGDLDVAINGFWLENPLPDQRPEIGPWLEHAIDPSWPPDAKVEVADLDADGRSDVLISRSEAAGGRLAWYGAIDPRLGPWTEHVIDPTADHNHSLQVGDLDRDGDLDVVAAEMHQSPGEDEVRIFFNEGGALGWTEQIVDAKGSHNLRLVDVDRDGDLDLYGANWHGETGVDLWLNGVRNPGDSLPLDRWVRHSIDPDLPWRALLLAAGDIDLDGDPDIATGGWWYENPGAVSGLWTRREIGAPLYNLAALLDLDGDGDLDVLGTNGQPSGGALSWARNDGSGSFESLPGLPSSTGDFLQGVATGRFAPAGPVQVVLSWHAGAALELLTPPADPAGPGWTLSRCRASRSSRISAPRTWMETGTWTCSRARGGCATTRGPGPASSPTRSVVCSTATV